MSLKQLMRWEAMARAARDGLDGRQLVVAEQIQLERDKTRVLLGSHGRFTASFALSRDPGRQTYIEYQRMVERMRGGGARRAVALGSHE